VARSEVEGGQFLVFPDFFLSSRPGWWNRVNLPGRGKVC